MIVFSTLIYALGKAVGPHKAAAMFNHWVSQPSPNTPLDCLVTLQSIQRVAPVEPVAVLCDAAGAHIGKARSRLFTLAYDSMKEPTDIWVTCDDDVAIPPGTAKRLIDAVRGSEPRIVTVPYALRGSATSSVLSPNGEAVLADPKNIDVIWADGDAPEGMARIDSAGFGCVAMNREAMHLVGLNSIMFWELDRVWRGPFCDLLTPTVDGPRDVRGLVDWHTEDRSFFNRVPFEVQKFALTVGQSTHAGLTLNLEQAK